MLSNTYSWFKINYNKVFNTDSDRMIIYNVWKIIIIIKFTYFDIFSNIIGREETPHKQPCKDCVQYKGQKERMSWCQ